MKYGPGQSPLALAVKGVLPNAVAQTRKPPIDSKRYRSRVQMGHHAARGNGIVRKPPPVPFRGEPQG